MFLKRIEMCGFKTFAERTEVEFVPGFMAVVGPNGSGKSNLTDAIRYCLGEQSTKTLRATRLEELVFAGTPARRAAALGEVTAVFDNSDGHLPVDFSEVAITRKTTRDGDSHYFINRTPCRLKDIHELLMGSGIGPGSFSVLGSKEVDMVLSSDPKDRRSMLEETAGTNRYRFRKKEAARKLEHTATNLVRLRDILKEVEGSVEDSRKAVARYERYKVAQDQLQGLEVRVARADMEILLGQAQTVRQKAQGLETASQAADEQELNLGLELEEAEARRSERDVRRDEVQARVAATREELSRTRASHEGLFKRASELEHGARAAQGRLESSQERIQERGVEAETLTRELPELERSLSEARTRLAELRQELAACPEARGGPGSEIRARLATLERERTQLNARLETLKARTEQESTRRQEALDQARLLRQEATRPQIELDPLEPARAQASEAARQEQAILESRQAASQALQQARAQRAEAEKRRRPMTTRVMELEAILEDRAGLPPAVRTVLAWKEPGTVGVVGELIQVREGLEVAMEAALGGRLADVITRDRHTASRLVDRLKRERAGRVTFWPLDLERRESDPIPLPTREGVVGQALDLIGFAQELRPVLAQMLGSTVVMKDLPSALALYDRCRGRRPHVVTLQGEYLSPTGALTGGSLRGDRSGMLARRRQLEQARAELKAREAELARLHGLEETESAKLAEAEQALSRAREEARRARQVVADLEAELRRQEKDSRRALLAAEKLEAEARGPEEKGLRHEVERKTALDRLDVLGEEWDDLREKLTRSQEEEARQQVQRESLRRQVMEAELETERRTQRLAERQREIHRVRQRLDELQADRVAAGAEVERATVARLELEREGAELQARTDLLAGRLVEEEKALAEVRQESSGQDDHLKSLRARHAEISRQARELGEELHRHQVELAGLEARLEQARTRLEEVGELEEAPEEPADFDLEKARAQARRLRGFLENFGSVNLGAREDFERLSTRHVELKAQIEDLEEASDGLKRIMAEMDRASITQFQAVFQQVNETFGRLFGEIFGGGWARLELCNPEDLLESGVEIVACPPGKKLQNLTLFSSGERALSAIAFLLSLLTHKPSPIVVLDELDAPLDDANVEKVATRLLEFSTSSQFLVITHNRKTMEFADRLYGVTMEEPGVSRLLSVELRGENGEKLEGGGPGARRADSRTPEAVLA